MAEKALTELTRDLRALYTRGYDALQRENFDYAIEMFTQVLIKDPQLYECRKALRMAQLKKAGAGSSGFFSKVKSFGGKIGSSPLVAQGQMALRNDPLQAIQIAEQIIAGDAYSNPGHKLLADAAIAAEMPKTAVMSLEILVKNSPRDKELNLKLAESLAMSDQKSKAERILAELQKEYPNDNDIFMALKNISARKTMDEGGYEAASTGQASYRDMLRNKDEAVSLEQEKRQVKSEDVTERLIREYEVRLKTEPSNLKLLRDLGDLYSQKSQFDRALGYYEQIATSDGGNEASLQSKIAATRVKKFEQAISQLDPNAEDYSAAVAQINAERTAYQLDECKKRSDRYPTDLLIRFELGVLYFDNGKISEAIQEFQKACNNPNKSIQAKNYLAQCFSKRNMNDMAARKLEEALKEKLVFDEEKKDLIYTLGSVLEKMGKKEEAIAQFKTIYEADIGYKDVSKKIDDYYSGS